MAFDVDEWRKREPVNLPQRQIRLGVCAWCGSSDVLHLINNDDYPAYWLICTDCSCEMPHDKDGISFNIHSHSYRGSVLKGYPPVLNWHEWTDLDYGQGTYSVE